MLTSGTVLNQRYRIKQMLGEGGMGRVFLGRDERLDRAVALKQLTAKDPAAMQLFRREADLLATLDHPHLVRVTDTFDEQGCLYLVMELVEGDTLTTVLSKTPNGLPVTSVCEWAEGLLETLVYVHQRGVVVRDIKPDNLHARSDELHSATRLRHHTAGSARRRAAWPAAWGRQATPPSSNMAASLSTAGRTSTRWGRRSTRC